MGQIQSTADACNCEGVGQGVYSPRATGNINSRRHHSRQMSHDKSSKRANFGNNHHQFDDNVDDDDVDDEHHQHQQHQRHIRKLSNVSNRNIQLLSMKPRSDRDAYADGLRARRRSSLINLILGAPSSGPRFSDDLCSLSSHMSELHCNFNIDYFPDASAYRNTTNSMSIASLAPLDEVSSHNGGGCWSATAAAAIGGGVVDADGVGGSGNGNYVKSMTGLHLNEQQQQRLQYVNSGAVRSTDEHSCDAHQSQSQSRQQQHHYHHHHRRRSSLGSLSSFESAGATMQGFSGAGVAAATSSTTTPKVVKVNPFHGISIDPANEMNCAQHKMAISGDKCQRDPTGQPTPLPGDDEVKDGDSQSHHADDRNVPSPEINNQAQLSCNATAAAAPTKNELEVESSGQQQLQQHDQRRRQFYRRRPSLSSTFLASIDLTSSLDCNESTDASKSEQVADEQHNQLVVSPRRRAPPLVKSGLRDYGTGCSGGDSGCSHDSVWAQKTTCVTNMCANKAASTVEAAAAATPLKADNSNGSTGSGPVTGCINQANVRRMLHRSGSELSLYSSASASSSGNMSHHQLFHHHQQQQQHCNHPHHHHNYRQHLTASNSSPLHNRNVNKVFEQSCCGGGGGGGGGFSGSLGRPRKLPSHGPAKASGGQEQQTTAAFVGETKLIIMLQVCLPFILAGFGNMSAGLVLNKIAHWNAFRRVPMFFVLLPSFVGLKGNIEMTLASRLSTLANLHLLETSYQRRHAFASNLILILSQAIGLSVFAAFSSMLCEFLMGRLHVELVELLKISIMVVLPCALITSMVLVILSSVIMWLAIWMANLIQVNPDNLSTLVAAMYGDVTCVLTYGLFAELMYSCHEQAVYTWPLMIVCCALVSWPVLAYAAYKFKETHELAVSSMPPMLIGIVVSLGSGTVLSMVMGRFNRLALYQPVVNGFGANLIAVQASRVSTWLWCGALRRLSSAPPQQTTREISSGSAQIKPSKLSASLVSFAESVSLHGHEFDDGSKTSDSPGKWSMVSSSLLTIRKLALKLIRTLLWSFLNPSPNSLAARLLLMMIIPAHTLYFFVIWLLSPANYVAITWQFYVVYIVLCVCQVFILLTICEPLMTLLMRRHLDPDIFGISLLMALADLIGTLCLTGAFIFLASIGDPNAF